MSLFLPSIPQASDNLDFSQGQLLSNNSGLDTVFGVDHYKFSDASSSKGFHNTVTTPLIVGSAHPATTANPIFYAMQDYSAIGLLQYSRGPTSAVPSPLTYLQSPATPIALASLGTTNLINFAGMTSAMCVGYAQDVTGGQNPSACLISWNGTVISFKTLGTINTLQFGASGSTLIITNASGGNISLNWSLQFLRIK